ncbi:MAG: N-acetyltransferase family protein [Alphaproteobacteria bacterium]
MERVNHFNLAGLNIYQATVGDADLVAMLVFQLLKELGQHQTRQTEYAMFKACSKILEEDNGAFALLAVDGNKIPISVMTLAEAQALSAFGKFGIIMEHYVVKDARSLGIGEKLLEAAIKLGKAQKWAFLQVAAPGGNMAQRTQNFYKRNQFKVTGNFMQLSLKDGIPS